MYLRNIQAIIEQLPELCERLEIPARIPDAYLDLAHVGEHRAIRVDLGTLDDGAFIWFLVADSKPIKVLFLGGSRAGQEISLAEEPI